MQLGPLRNIPINLVLEGMVRIVVVRMDVLAVPREIVIISLARSISTPSR